MVLKYLPEPKDYHKYWYIDVEADSLWPSKLWVLCASRMDQPDVHSFVGEKAIRGFFDGLRGQEVYFIGHNALSYDCVHTERLAGGFANVTNTVDTLVLSYLYDPNLVGGHSLHAWGDRFNFPKLDYNDFSRYTPEMDKYCQQDVKLGKRVFKALVQRMRRLGMSELACKIEHEIRVVVDEQERAGWYFDIPGAQALVSQLRSEQHRLEGPIRALFPPRLEVCGTYKRRYKKDGSDYSSYVKHLTEYPEIRDNGDGTYSVLDWTEFNIGSPKQRIQRLLELGYQPVNYTEKGSPKVDEESLIAYAESSGYTEVQAIADWLVLQGRSTMVEGWLNNVNYEDSRMHGKVLTCGARTRRMRHMSPNTANIPKAKDRVKYGKECRGLWMATPGRLEVGTDASGLELRMFAQYLNNPEATKLYTEGDPHLFNTRLLGEPDEYRDLAAKNVIYAMLYGAMDTKLGYTAKTSITDPKEAKAHGAWVRSKLEVGIPGFQELTEQIKTEYKVNNGLIKTIDGGFVRCPAPHAAINYKLQSAGAITMKVAGILARNEIKRRGLDSFFVGNIHDEFQSDSAPGDAEEVGKVCVQAITTAGEELGMHVPLTGEYKIGQNWAQTH
jgi:DNA polymerase-1